MKKKVTFEKEVEFSTMIGEITAISLENNLMFLDEANIGGDLVLSGKYKMTEASCIDEEFSYSIPVEIALTEKLDLNTAKVDITNFTYKIENEDIMICNIELTVEGLEQLDIEEIEDVRCECDGDSKEEKEIEVPKQEKKENTSLIMNFDEEETYGTFLVYIVRQNESINTIIEKYNTSIEEIEKYNDLNDLSIGTKLIIPITNE